MELDSAVFFVDVCSTHRVHEGAEIIQLGVTTLDRPSSEFNRFAVPKEEIHPDSVPVHGITRTDVGGIQRDGQKIENSFKGEKALVKSFCEFFNKYDADHVPTEVFFVYYSPWKWSMLKTALERYQFPDWYDGTILDEFCIVPVDLMELLKQNCSARLGNDLSMDNAIKMFDEQSSDGRYQDAHKNAMALKRVAKAAAKSTGIPIRMFLGDMNDLGF